MTTRYVAHGLQLHSSFPLPGMSPTAIDSLPALALELVSAAELDASWRGAGGPPEWRGRLGDGRSLSIDRSASGELLFTYGDRARFRLAANRRRLDCAPAHAGPDWQRALLGNVLPSVSVMRGYEALHAGVVDSPDGVIAIAGPTGAGKSTLVLELMRRGWPLFADDQLTLENGERSVRAQPGTSHMNLPSELPDGSDPRAAGTVIAVIAGERWLTTATRSTRARRVRMICLLDRRRGRERLRGAAARAHALPANLMAIAPYILGLSTSAARQRTRFRLYADLVEHTPLVRLAGALESPPAELADALEHALADEPSAHARASLIEGAA